MKLRVLGSNDSRTAFIIARDAKRFDEFTPVVIWRDGVIYYHQEMTLGVVYKFGLWNDEYFKIDVEIDAKKNLDFPNRGS